MNTERMFKQIANMVDSVYLEDTVKNIQDILDVKSGPILTDLGVAKWKFSYNLPANVASFGTKNVEQEVIVQKDKYADETRGREKVVSVPNGGSIKFVYWPVEGKEWDEDEENTLRFMFELFFILYGRANLSALFEKVNFHDGVTGAPNRVYLFKLVGERLAAGDADEYIAGRVNIKNFKQVNDRYGSNVGDSYLAAFFKAVGIYMGTNECFARLGGDNFTIFIKKEHWGEVSKILENVEFDLDIGGSMRTFNPKLRAGLYQMKKGDGVHQLMQSINEAYQVSQMPDSPDFVWYEQHMSERGQRVRQIVEEFPKAMEKGEFVAYYQPKVLLETSTLCGAEALCRWVKDGKIVPPMEFIPILEKDGSITRLDFYMLECVCRDIAAWKAQGIVPGRISVNFSKHHLHNEKLGETIVSILDKYGVEHEYIEVELTEMSGYDNYDEMRRFVAYMKSQDVATSVDDFGTGYSSLNMLTDIRSDIVKLDKSFLDDIEAKPDVHKKLVKNIINMINELGMETLAEGVENAHQAEMLKKWECRMVQGYLFDKPLPVEEFTDRLINPQYEV